MTNTATISTRDRTNKILEERGIPPIPDDISDDSWSWDDDEGGDDSWSWNDVGGGDDSWSWDDDEEFYGVDTSMK